MSSFQNYTHHIFDRYEYIKLLGRGMKGDVYEVYDNVTDTNVALKITGDDDIDYSFYKTINLDSFVQVYDIYYVENTQENQEFISSKYPDFIWEEPLVDYDDLLVYTMQIYKPWKDFEEEKVYKLLKDFAIFHCETFFVWEDFCGNILKDENDNFIFIDLDEVSSNGEVDIDFSNDVLDYFMGFSRKSDEYYTKLENNLDVSPCYWKF